MLSVHYETRPNLSQVSAVIVDLENILADGTSLLQMTAGPRETLK